MWPTFATETGLLDSTEGCDLGRDNSGIDTDDPVVKGLINTEGSRKILGVEICGQPILGIISERDSLILAIKFENRSDGTKGLL